MKRDGSHTTLPPKAPSRKPPLHTSWFPLMHHYPGSCHELRYSSLCRARAFHSDVGFAEITFDRFIRRTGNAFWPAPLIKWGRGGGGGQLKICLGNHLERFHFPVCTSVCSCLNTLDATWVTGNTFCFLNCILHAVLVDLV